MYPEDFEEIMICPYCRFFPGGRPPGQPPGRPPTGPPGRPPSQPPGRPPTGPPGRPPGQPPGRPPTGPPGRPPGQPPGRPPTGPPGRPPMGRPPMGPPPTFLPSKALGQPFVFAVDPGAIRGCLYRYSYIWLVNGRSFWAFITFVGRRSIAGWRWNGRFWVYFGIDLRRIESFYCH